MSKTTDYQRILKAKGYYQGKLDGDFGPQTLQASITYQTDLIRQKIPGYKAPAWVLYCIHEYGQKERKGGENPRIIHYHTFTSLKATEDEIAWCASFVNAALREGAGINGTNSAAAASFKTYGKQCSPETFGAICLKKTKTGSMRHVFINVGYHNGTVFGFGGNQSDMANVVAYDTSVITESRYPAEIMIPFAPV